MDLLFAAALAILALGFLAVCYLMLGLPRLWGEERGVPFCGHPFEQTWGRQPPVKAWRCPKCLTSFVVDEERHRWVPERNR